MVGREGTLTYKTAGDRKTAWINEYLIKVDEGIYYAVRIISSIPLSRIFRVMPMLPGNVLTEGYLNF